MIDFKEWWAGREYCNGIDESEDAFESAKVMTMKPISKWMRKPCLHHTYNRGRFECQTCMQELNKALKKGEFPQ